MNTDMRTLRKKSTNIYDIIDKLKVPNYIKNLINDRYFQLVGKKTLRKDNRRGLIAVISYNICVKNNQLKMYHEIVNDLGIKETAIPKGKKLYNKYTKNDRKLVRLDISKLVYKMLDMYGDIDLSVDRNSIIEIYHNLKEKSEKISRAKPQSIAATLLFYLIKKHVEIDKKSFCKKVKVSTITIDKFLPEIKLYCY